MPNKVKLHHCPEPSPNRVPFIPARHQVAPKHRAAINCGARLVTLSMLRPQTENVQCLTIKRYTNPGLNYSKERSCSVSLGFRLTTDVYQRNRVEACFIAITRKPTETVTSIRPIHQIPDFEKRIGSQTREGSSFASSHKQGFERAILASVGLA